MDVTEYERLSAALQISETRLSTAITHTPIVLFSLDRDGVFTFCDGGALLSQGIAPGSLVGASVVSWLGEYPAVIELSQRGLAGESMITTIEFDETIYELWWTAEHDSNGQPNGGFGLAVDVTETVHARRDAEHARAAAVELAQLRSDFVAAVSHELRTPLTSMIGYGELLRSHWHQFDDAKRFDRLDRMVQAANRQKRLVEDLLLLTRLDSDLVPQPTPFSLAPVVERVAEETIGTYPGQGFELGGPRDLRVFANQERTLQILANIIDNAAKYSPEGSAIGVEWTPEDGLAVVRVRDAGTGIAGESLGQLFTRFGRIPGSRIRAGHVGTGLGLYLGRRLARAMGGDLDLESTGPTGSTFRLSLPLATG
jgi:signal transduction histidine kinase